MSGHLELREQDMPAWLRYVLVTLLIGGVLAMHTLLLGTTHGSSVSHDGMVTAVSDGVHHVGAAAAEAASAISSPTPDGSGAMDSCGGLASLCLAMIIGVSAHIWLTKRRNDRVLWQLPPPRTSVPVPLSRFRDPRDPRERTNLLRC